jgi:hypothetical protein
MAHWARPKKNILFFMPHGRSALSLVRPPPPYALAVRSALSGCSCVKVKLFVYEQLISNILRKYFLSENIFLDNCTLWSACALDLVVGSDLDTDT